MPVSAGNGPDPSRRHRSGQDDVQDDVQEGSCAAEPSAAPPRCQWQITPQERDIMARFRQDYCDLLEARVARIRECLSADQFLCGDQRESTHVALISLWASSAMVGADNLVSAVEKLRDAVTGGTTSEFRPLLEQLDCEVAAVRTALEG